jgi:hypothetical protein
MAAKLRLAILSLWLGAMLMFGAGIAPAAFSVLKNEQRRAGDIVNLVLHGTEITGIGLGLTLLLLLLLSKELRSRRFKLEAALLALMTLAILLSKFVVSARLHALREQYGETLQTLAATDPAKLAFNQLHQYSVWLMSFAMLAALLLIVLHIRYTPTNKSSHA